MEFTGMKLAQARARVRKPKSYARKLDTVDFASHRAAGSPFRERAQGLRGGPKGPRGKTGRARAPDSARSTR